MAWSFKDSKPAGRPSREKGMPSALRQREGLGVGLRGWS